MKNYLSKLIWSGKSASQNEIADKPTPKSEKTERLTIETRTVLNLAQKEAERLKHQYVGPEHILVGLLKEPDGIAHRVLLESGIDESRLTALLDELTAAYPKTEAIMDLSNGTKKALECAVDEARTRGETKIDTQHMLLGVLRGRDNVAITMIKRAGVEPEKLYKRVKLYMNA